MDITHRDLTHGIAANRGQFVQFLLQVFFVGALVGMTRTVLPVLSESDFAWPRGRSPRWRASW